MLVDTHCHIHEADYPLDAVETVKRAFNNDVNQIICVGTSEESSRQAVAFASGREGVYAAVGVHPHETKDGWAGIARLVDSVHLENGFADAPTELFAAAGVFTNEGVRRDSTAIKRKIVAVGEIGLDYFYTHSPREVQIKALEEQIDLALKHDLPIIFHVREAFDDFWPIFDNFSGIRGVLHSFTDSQVNLDRGLGHGLYVGVNGISTFTRDIAQKAVFTTIPLGRLLLETDAPFLTPAPLRGKVNEPAFVKNVALFHAADRMISFEELAGVTTANARALFAL